MNIHNDLNFWPLLAILVMCCLMSSCVFTQQYRLVNEGFQHIDGTKPPRYVKGTDSVLTSSTFSNYNWGRYNFHFNIDNANANDTIIFNFQTLTIFDKWGDARNVTTTGTPLLEDSAKSIILLPQSKMKLFFAANSLIDINKKLWADSVWIVLPELMSSSGLILMPRDTLLFIKQ